MKNLTFLILCFFLSTAFSFGQDIRPDRLKLSGIIYGYSFDPSKKILKKNNETELEGAVGNVRIIIRDNHKELANLKTGEAGRFELYLPLENELRFEFFKQNYVSSSFLIDMSEVPDELAEQGLKFEYMELILNSFVSKDTDDDRPFGKLYYDKSQSAIAFEKINYKDKDKLFKKEDDTPVNLMEGAVAKNLDNNDITKRNGSGDMYGVDQKSKPDILTESPMESDSEDEEHNQILSLKEKYSLPAVFDLQDISFEDIDSREEQLEKAWAQLERDKMFAVTPKDFEIIEVREELLLALARELDHAKAYIALQEEEIAAQRTKVIMLSVLVLLLLVFGFFIFRSMRQKAALNRDLNAKNKRITTSLNYAFRIQQSVLLSEEQIREIVPEFFVLYKPLDIVSGDFYWVSKINDQVILAAVDCTGHGIPGAFMSLIGNTLLNEIINEKKITDPVEILEQLDEGISKALRQDESAMNNQDGMDMSVCVIDQKKKIIEYSGAMNPVYLVEEGEVIELKPTLKGIGGNGIFKRKKNIKFQKSVKSITDKTSVYMISDGYTDQFGGPENKKFNLQQFRELLLKIDNMSMNDRRSFMDLTFESWRGDAPQTDDILIMGICLSEKVEAIVQLFQKEHQEI